MTVRNIHFVNNFFITTAELWMIVFISDIQIPERPKLHYIDRAPNYSNSQIRPPKMFKMLDLMRGPELVHNKLIHKQFGIQV